MSEIVASNVESNTIETTEQVIEDLQNVGIVDKAAKLAALRNDDVEATPPAQQEVTNSPSNLGDKSEIHHNGTTQNGDAVVEQAAETKSTEAANPDEPTKESTDEKTPMEASATSAGTESPKKTDELKAEESSNSESKSDDQLGQTNVEEVTSGYVPEAEAVSNSESKKSPVKEGSGEGQAEGDQVNKPVEDENTKASPGKKSCSPF